MDALEKTIEFVREHANEDVNALRLKYASKKELGLEIDLEFALLQIEARKKNKKKLPSFLCHPNFIFPTLLSSEQASNEAVAKFHASLIDPTSSLLDLTAGLGIDAISFALNGINVTACEIERIKCEALIHNAKVMGVEHRLQIVEGDSIDFLCNHNGKFDIIFADPARRNNAGRRVHALSDCQPDILAAMPEIIKSTRRLLVKSSPLLDLSLIRDTVSDLRHIYVVCFKGECKEVLIDIQKDSSFEGVTVVDICKESELSRFHTEFLATNNCKKISLCNKKKASDFRYLYEPNSGVMKTGAWSELIDNYPELFKADINTHIFLSDTFYRDFPGRVLETTTEPDKKALKAMKSKRINVVSRNHPLSAPQIASKFSLIPGSDTFLYAFRYRNNPILLIAKPVSI